MTDSVQNVFFNAILPYDIRRQQLVVGCAQLVAIEVVVAKLIRKILGMGNRGVLELAAVHAVSLPFLGGVGGFFAPNGGLGGEKFTDSLWAGVQAVPAVFLSQYIINTGASGFHVPKISFKDVLVTAASKAVSRPLIVLAYPKLHATLQQNFDLWNAMEQAQNAASNLKAGMRGQG